MKELVLKSGKRALVLVAHPDDETIWMGGTILTNKQVEWTCFSLCRLSDNDRRPKFRRVCRFLNARSMMADFDDEGRVGLSESIGLIKSLVKKRLQGRAYDYIFTHGLNGDYGHERHIGLSKAVKALQAEGFFKGARVFYFSYKKNNRNRTTMAPSLSAEIRKKLPEKIFLEKKRIVSEMYGYPYMGIDVGLCTREEAFVGEGSE